MTLVLSARVGTNADVFPDVMALHVTAGSRVADVTYGKGVFWRRIPPGTYDLVATDLAADGVDARVLPYESEEFDAVVFDPPYMHTSETSLTFQGYEANYRNVETFGTKQRSDGPKYHQAVLDLYVQAAREAWRVLRPGGHYIVKCQDEVCQSKNRWSHVEIMDALALMNFRCKDLFIVVRKDIPPVSRMKIQAHARKNHSYFLVFVKPKGRPRGRLEGPAAPVAREDVAGNGTNGRCPGHDDRRTGQGVGLLVGEPAGESP